MNIPTTVKYYVPYIPYHCRNTRYKEIEEVMDIELKEAKEDELKLAFITQYSDDITHIYAYKNKLWEKATIRTICAGGECENYHTPLEAMKWWQLNGSFYYARNYEVDRTKIIEIAQDDMNDYLLVSGELYVQTREPAFDITTFGLGHNHGGTGLFVVYPLKHDSKANKYYFNALQEKEAIKHATKVALNRGDDKSVPFDYTHIQVLMPEMVKRKPRTYGLEV